MQLNSVVLFVKDISISKQFYLQILGFTIEHDFGANIIFKEMLAIWQIKDDHIIPKSTETRGKSNRMELYFETENVDAIFEKLKAVGINFLHQIHEEPWGQRTIRFFDPDNHLIEIGESLATMVKNMAAKEMNVEEIHLKTGLNEDLIKTLMK